ncbi:hypothetical protein NEPAR04_1636 [Nematocida parisii]|nr:hypothetical protein NEPAR08_1701 [Nematocida parisii]KAI5129752.1 hypothetical protein NEPAR03_1787 [Nematocida parisii]KAI5142814.1 hypothetical protein NEPAR04_1636 [Nematocida parisii]
MALKESAYIFYTFTNCISDLEFLQITCNEFGLYLYVEENRKTANYMISGKTFVIDIFYEREEETCTEEGEDAQSIGSSVMQIGKEQVEAAFQRIKKVGISLLEEEWSSYFKLCTFSFMFHLKNKDYYNAYRLISSIIKYDSEEENAGFSEIIRKLKLIESTQCGPLDYSFLHHVPLVHHKIDSESKLNNSLGIFSCINESGRENLYNITDIKNIPLIDVLVDVIIEMFIYGIEISIEERVIISACINKEKCCIEVDGRGQVIVDGVVDRYRTLLFKRTSSLYHVICETGVEVAHTV